MPSRDEFVQVLNHLTLPEALTSVALSILFTAVAAALGYRRRVRRIRGPSTEVPMWGECLLLLLCSPEQGEAMAGDFQERHARHAARHGFRFANVWYWGQVARSAGPLLWAALWRMVAVKEIVKRLWPW